MSAKDDINRLLLYTDKSKHKNYPAFVEELAALVELLRSFDSISLQTDKDPALQEIQSTVKKLARQIDGLNESKRNSWAPQPKGFSADASDKDKQAYHERGAAYLDAVRDWTQLALTLGSALEEQPRDTVSERIQYPVFLTAKVWERHFGEMPKAGESAPFVILFNGLFKRVTASANTLRNVLNSL